MPSALSVARLSARMNSRVTRCISSCFTSPRQRGVMCGAARPGNIAASDWHITGTCVCFGVWICQCVCDRALPTWLPLTWGTFTLPHLVTVVFTLTRLAWDCGQSQRSEASDTVFPSGFNIFREVWSELWCCEIPQLQSCSRWVSGNRRCALSHHQPCNFI